MRDESSKKGLVVIIIIILTIGAVGAWVFWGLNRIITAVPEDAADGERVILITPRATPTSEFEPTPTLTEEEQAALDEAATPTEESEEDVAPTPEEEEEDPTPTEEVDE